MNNLLLTVIKDTIKKTLTNNLGTVKETTNQLICYIKKSNIIKKSNHYKIICNGLIPTTKSIAKKYQLNKPIIYIIENLTFDKPVYIFGNETSNIIIKNSTFLSGLNIVTTGNCTLDNNEIINFITMDFYANNLSINNQQIIDKYSKYNSIILIAANNKLEINNSNIGTPTTSLELVSKDELKIVNSHLSGNDIIISAPKVLSDDINNKQFTTVNIPNIRHPKSQLPKKLIKNNDYLPQTEKIS